MTKKDERIIMRMGKRKDRLEKRLNKIGCKLTRLEGRSYKILDNCFLNTKNIVKRRIAQIQYRVTKIRIGILIFRRGLIIDRLAYCFR